MSYERTALSNAELDDLDLDALAAYVRTRVGDEVDDREGWAARMGLVGKSAGRMAPTPAGLLMFGRLPQLLHPEWGLSAVKVSGTTLADPVVARADLEGPIPTMLEDALAFAREHSASLERGAAEYPEPALREALVNALVHRELRKPGRVALRLFDDRLEVWNPAAPNDLGDLDEVLLRGGISLPKNPILASTARVLDLCEQVGRGMPRMRRALAEGPSVRLEARVTSRDFLVQFPSRYVPASLEPS